MGARFGVTPERPYHRQMFEEGQDAPGIRRVVRIPFLTLRNRSPKHLPAGTLSIGPKAPGGFPVGPRRRLVSPCPTTGKPDAPPALPPMAPASGPKPQRPSPQSLISTSPQESLSWNLTAFTHTRARLPHSPGERPRTSPCETPTPPI